MVCDSSVPRRAANDFDINVTDAPRSHNARTFNCMTDVSRDGDTNTIDEILFLKTGNLPVKVKHSRGCCISFKFLLQIYDKKVTLANKKEAPPPGWRGREAEA